MRLSFRFPEGCLKALTFSYDDGVIYDEQLISIFNEYGMKATFNLNSGLFGIYRRLTKDKLSIYEGHEIACHGLLHEYLPDLSPMAALEEVLEDRKNLEKMTGRIVRGMAYAYGGQNEDTMRLLERSGIAYCRLAGSSMNFKVPNNFLQWTGTCHHAAGNLMELGDRFLNHASTIIPSIMYVWGHSYEFNDSNNWNVIEDFCRLTAHRKDVWYATNIQIYDYVQATKRVVTSADCHIIYNPSCIPVWANNGKEVFKIGPGETVEK